MESIGFIKLYRKILDNPIICKDTDYFAIWIYLLLNATHQEYDVVFKGERITLKPGQLITGRKIISEKFGIDENKVQRILKNLEKQHQIEQQTSSKNRLISIVNWNEYQAERHQNKQQVNNERTTSEQQVNTNKNVKNERMKENNIVVVEDDGRTGDFQKIVKFYQENIGMLTPNGIEVLESYIKDFPEEVIIYAMKRADEANIRTMDYIRGILNNWQRAGVKSLIQAQQETEKFKNKKLTPNLKTKKVDNSNMDRFIERMREKGVE